MTDQPEDQSLHDGARLLALATSLAQADSAFVMYQLVGRYIRLHSSTDLASICIIDPSDPDVFEAVALTGSDGTGSDGTGSDSARPDSAESETWSSAPSTPASERGGIRMPLEQTLVGEVVATGEPQLWTLESSNDNERSSLLAEGVVAAFIAPIRCEQTRYGTLNIGYVQDPRDDYPFQDLLIRLSELLGCQLARLERQNEITSQSDTRHHRASELEKLHSLESVLATADSLEEVIGILSANLARLVDVSYVSFTKITSSPNNSIVYEIHGSSAVRIDTSLSVGEQIFRRQIASVEPHLTPNKGTSGLMATSKPVKQARSSAEPATALNLTVFVHGTGIGTLNISSSRPGGVSAADHKTLAAVATFMGATLQRIVTHNELVFVANHDHLTGLIRHRMFEAELEAEIQRAVAIKSPDDSDHPQSALCFIDIDHFKLINDADGHNAGDKLLRDIGARISRSLGGDDTPSRLGADFVVLLRGRTPKHHRQLCQEIATSISAMPFIFNGRVFEATVSIGLSFVTETTVSGATAMASAEAACHESKKLGGNHVSVESSSNSEQAARRTAASWIARVQRALDANEFVLYAQPIHPLSSSGNRSVEVLVRLRDEDGSIIPPDRFIPIAEQYGLISRLDAWVTENALRAMKKALDNEPQGQAPELMFINLSANSISSKNFFQELETIIVNSGVPTDRIIFEITETGSMSDFEATLDFVRRMRAFGPRLALDDFGVGLSSLGYLRQLDIDFLKIDGTLICDVGADPIKATMVSAIKAMADALQVETIAEHIDSEHDLRTLKGIGIDHVQGYFVGHPAPIERALTIAPDDKLYKTPPDVNSQREPSRSIISDFSSGPQIRRQ